MSVTEANSGWKRRAFEWIGDAHSKENAHVENPDPLAMLASRARGNQRNMFIASFTRVRGR